MMLNVSSMGSCRVFTPLQILHKDNRIVHRPEPIYGFTHYTAEIIQQLSFLSGQARIHRRLWPYVNIPNWVKEPTAKLDQIADLFPNTDIFVIEISSIRKVMFKAVFLQINRVADLLGKDMPAHVEWWKSFLRGGGAALPPESGYGDPVKFEVASALRLFEQSEQKVMADAQKLADLLKRPIVFVSHFNTDYNGKPIPQRATIVNALRMFCEKSGHIFVDPTLHIHAGGLSNTIKDLGHYKPEFEPKMANVLFDGVQAAAD